MDSSPGCAQSRGLSEMNNRELGFLVWAEAPTDVFPKRLRQRGWALQDARPRSAGGRRLRSPAEKVLGAVLQAVQGALFTD